ncbi:MAG: zinc ribbon domain-containing protein [Dehalococcoidia bacterium]
MDVLLSWPGGSWQSSARFVGGLTAAYLLILWLASIMWVYRDIRSRTTDPASHLISVAIAVMFPIVGLPIYLILRPAETLTGSYDRQLEQEALLSELQSVSACPNCRRPVQDEFVVCAFCATPVKHACSRCGQQLRLSWRFCPYCAAPRVVPQAGERPRGAEAAAATSRSSTCEAALEAIRRASGRPADASEPEYGYGDEDETPEPRRPAAESGGPAPRPRPRPRSDPDR